MNPKNVFKKHLVTILVAIICCFAILGGSLFAYFRSSDGNGVSSPSGTIKPTEVPVPPEYNLTSVAIDQAQGWVFTNNTLDEALFNMVTVTVTYTPIDSTEAAPAAEEEGEGPVLDVQVLVFEGAPSVQDGVATCKAKTGENVTISQNKGSSSTTVDVDVMPRGNAQIDPNNSNAGKTSSTFNWGDSSVNGITAVFTAPTNGTIIYTNTANNTLKNYVRVYEAYNDGSTTDNPVTTFNFEGNLFPDKVDSSMTIESTYSKAIKVKANVTIDGQSKEVETYVTITDIYYVLPNRVTGLTGSLHDQTARSTSLDLSGLEIILRYDGINNITVPASAFSSDFFSMIYSDEDGEPVVGDDQKPLLTRAVVKVELTFTYKEVTGVNDDSGEYPISVNPLSITSPAFPGARNATEKLIGWSGDEDSTYIDVSGWNYDTAYDDFGTPSPAPYIEICELELLSGGVYSEKPTSKTIKPYDEGASEIEDGIVKVTFPKPGIRYRVKIILDSKSDFWWDTPYNGAKPKGANADTDHFIVYFDVQVEKGETKVKSFSGINSTDNPYIYGNTIDISKLAISVVRIDSETNEEYTIGYDSEENKSLWGYSPFSAIDAHVSDDGFYYYLKFYTEQPTFNEDGTVSGTEYDGALTDGSEYGGTLSAGLPKDAGTYYAVAFTYENSCYFSSHSEAIEFTINKFNITTNPITETFSRTVWDLDTLIPRWSNDQLGGNFPYSDKPATVLNFNSNVAQDSDGYNVTKFYHAGEYTVTLSFKNADEKNYEFASDACKTIKVTISTYTGSELTLKFEQSWYYNQHDNGVQVTVTRNGSGYYPSNIKSDGKWYTTELADDFEVNYYYKNDYDTETKTAKSGKAPINLSEHPLNSFEKGNYIVELIARPRNNSKNETTARDKDTNVDYTIPVEWLEFVVTPAPIVTPYLENPWVSSTETAQKVYRYGENDGAAKFELKNWKPYPLDEDEGDTVTKNDNLTADGKSNIITVTVRYKKFSAADYNVSDDSVLDRTANSFTVNEPGNYLVKIELNANYQWETDSKDSSVVFDSDGRTYSYVGFVARKELNTLSISGPVVETYDGTLHTKDLTVWENGYYSISDVSGTDFNGDDAQKINTPQNHDNDVVLEAHQFAVTNAGQYTVKVEITDKDKYVWAGSSYDGIKVSDNDDACFLTLNYTLNRVQLTVFDNVSYVTNGEDGSTDEHTYNGSEQTKRISTATDEIVNNSGKWISEALLISGIEYAAFDNLGSDSVDSGKIDSNTFKITDAGTYTITIIIKDKTNYQWYTSDEESSTEDYLVRPVTLTYILNRIKLTVLEDSDISGNGTDVYKGSIWTKEIGSVSENEFVGTANNKWVKAALEISEISVKSLYSSGTIDAQSYGIVKGSNQFTVLNAGTYTIKVAIKDAQKINYEWIDGGEDENQLSRALELTYTLNRVKLTVLEDDDIEGNGSDVYNAGEGYTKKISNVSENEFVGTANNKWVKAALEISEISYNAFKNLKTGSVEKSAIKDNTFAIKDAGEYHITVVIKEAQKINYVWIDGGEDEYQLSRDLNLIYTLNRAKLTVLEDDDIENNGNETYNGQQRTKAIGKTDGDSANWDNELIKIFDIESKTLNKKGKIDEESYWINQGTNTFTVINAGAYSVSVAIIDNINYEWNSGKEHDIANLTLTYTLNQAILYITWTGGDSNGNFRYEFDGSLKNGQKTPSAVPDAKNLYSNVKNEKGDGEYLQITKCLYYKVYEDGQLSGENWSTITANGIYYAVAIEFENSSSVNMASNYRLDYSYNDDGTIITVNDESIVQEFEIYALVFNKLWFKNYDGSDLGSDVGTPPEIQVTYEGKSFILTQFIKDYDYYVKGEISRIKIVAVKDDGEVVENWPKIKDVGSYTLRVDISDNNYNWSSTLQNDSARTFIINVVARNLTIDWKGLTTTYDKDGVMQPNGTLVGTVDDGEYIKGDKLDIGLELRYKYNKDNSPKSPEEETKRLKFIAGIYTVYAKLTGAAAKNYVLVGDSVSTKEGDELSALFTVNKKVLAIPTLSLKEDNDFNGKEGTVTITFENYNLVGETDFEITVSGVVPYDWFNPVRSKDDNLAIDIRADLLSAISEGVATFTYKRAGVYSFVFKIKATNYCWDSGNAGDFEFEDETYNYTLENELTVNLVELEVPYLYTWRAQEWGEVVEIDYQEAFSEYYTKSAGNAASSKASYTVKDTPYTVDYVIKYGNQGEEATSNDMLGLKIEGDSEGKNRGIYYVELTLNLDNAIDALNFKWKFNAKEDNEEKGRSGYIPAEDDYYYIYDIEQNGSAPIVRVKLYYAITAQQLKNVQLRVGTYNESDGSWGYTFGDNGYVNRNEPTAKFVENNSYSVGLGKTIYLHSDVEDEQAVLNNTIKVMTGKNPSTGEDYEITVKKGNLVLTDLVLGLPWDVGTYIISFTVHFGVDEDETYQDMNVSCTFKVRPRPIEVKWYKDESAKENGEVFTSTQYVYDGENHLPVPKITSVVTKTDGSDAHNYADDWGFEYVLEGGGSAVHANVGENAYYRVVIKSTSGNTANDNFTIDGSDTATFDFTISPNPYASITINAEENYVYLDAIIKAGKVNEEFITYTLSGFIEQDDYISACIQVKIYKGDTEITDNDKLVVGKYRIVVSWINPGSDPATDYTFTTEGKDFEIIQRKLTVTWDNNANSTYGDDIDLYKHVTLVLTNGKDRTVDGEYSKDSSVLGVAIQDIFDFTACRYEGGQYEPETSLDKTTVVGTYYVSPDYLNGSNANWKITFSGFSVDGHSYGQYKINNAQIKGDDEENKFVTETDLTYTSSEQEIFSSTPTFETANKQELQWEYGILTAGQYADSYDKDNVDTLFESLSADNKGVFTNSNIFVKDAGDYYYVLKISAPNHDYKVYKIQVKVEQATIGVSGSFTTETLYYKASDLDVFTGVPTFTLQGSDKVVWKYAELDNSDNKYENTAENLAKIEGLVWKDFTATENITVKDAGTYYYVIKISAADNIKGNYTNPVIYDKAFVTVKQAQIGVTNEFVTNSLEYNADYQDVFESIPTFTLRGTDTGVVYEYVLINKKSVDDSDYESYTSTFLDNGTTIESLLSGLTNLSWTSFNEYHNITVKDAGTHYFVIKISAGDNYVAKYFKVYVTVDKADIKENGQFETAELTYDATEQKVFTQAPAFSTFDLDAKCEIAEVGKDSYEEELTAEFLSSLSWKTFDIDTVTKKHAGTYYFVIKISAGDNYNVITYKYAVTVQKAVLEIKFDFTIMYGEVNPAEKSWKFDSASNEYAYIRSGNDGWTITGFKGGDETLFRNFTVVEGFKGGFFNLSGVAEYKIISYKAEDCAFNNLLGNHSIKAADNWNLACDNYTFTFVDGVLTVTEITLTVTVTGYNNLPKETDIYEVVYNTKDEIPNYIDEGHGYTVVYANSSYDSSEKFVLNDTFKAEYQKLIRISSDAFIKNDHRTTNDVNVYYFKIDTEYSEYFAFIITNSKNESGEVLDCKVEIVKATLDNELNNGLESITGFDAPYDEKYHGLYVNGEHSVTGDGNWTEGLDTLEHSASDGSKVTVELYTVTQQPGGITDSNWSSLNPQPIVGSYGLIDTTDGYIYIVYKIFAENGNYHNVYGFAMVRITQSENKLKEDAFFAFGKSDDDKAKVVQSENLAAAKVVWTYGYGESAKGGFATEGWDNIVVPEAEFKLAKSNNAVELLYELKYYKNSEGSGEELILSGSLPSFATDFAERFLSGGKGYNAGYYRLKVHMNLEATANFTFTPVYYVFQVAQRELTIKANEQKDIIYGEAAHALTLNDGLVDLVSKNADEVKKDTFTQVIGSYPAFETQYTVGNGATTDTIKYTIYVTEANKAIYKANAESFVNYKLNFVDADLVVNKRTINITIEKKESVYNKVPHTLTFKLNKNDDTFYIYSGDLLEGVDGKTTDFDSYNQNIIKLDTLAIHPVKDGVNTNNVKFKTPDDTSNSNIAGYAIYAVFKGNAGDNYAVVFSGSDMTLKATAADLVEGDISDVITSGDGKYNAATYTITKAPFTVEHKGVYHDVEVSGESKRVYTDTYSGYNNYFDVSLSDANASLEKTYYFITSDTDYSGSLNTSDSNKTEEVINVGTYAFKYTSADPNYETATITTKFYIYKAQLTLTAIATGEGGVTTVEYSTPLTGEVTDNDKFASRFSGFRYTVTTTGKDIITAEIDGGLKSSIVEKYLTNDGKIISYSFGGYKSSGKDVSQAGSEYTLSPVCDEDWDGNIQISYGDQITLKVVPRKVTVKIIGYGENDKAWSYYLGTSTALEDHINNDLLVEYYSKFIKIDGVEDAFGALYNKDNLKELYKALGIYLRLPLGGDNQFASDVGEYGMSYRSNATNYKVSFSNVASNPPKFQVEKAILTLNAEVAASNKVIYGDSLELNVPGNSYYTKDKLGIDLLGYYVDGLQGGELFIRDVLSYAEGTVISFTVTLKGNVDKNYTAWDSKVGETYIVKINHLNDVFKNYIVELYNDAELEIAPRKIVAEVTNSGRHFEYADNGSNGLYGNGHEATVKFTDKHGNNDDKIIEYAPVFTLTYDTTGSTKYGQTATAAPTIVGNFHVYVNLEKDTEEYKANYIFDTARSDVDDSGYRLKLPYNIEKLNVTAGGLTWSNTGISLEKYSGTYTNYINSYQEGYLDIVSFLFTPAADSNTKININEGVSGKTGVYYFVDGKIYLAIDLAESSILGNYALTVKLNDKALDNIMLTSNSQPVDVIVTEFDIVAKTLPMTINMSDFRYGESPEVIIKVDGNEPGSNVTLKYGLITGETSEGLITQLYNNSKTSSGLAAVDGLIFDNPTTNVNFKVGYYVLQAQCRVSGALLTRYYVFKVDKQIIEIENNIVFDFDHLSGYYTYTGAAQTLKMQFNQMLMSPSIEGGSMSFESARSVTFTATNRGKYYVYFELIDEDNTKWGSDLTKYNAELYGNLLRFTWEIGVDASENGTQEYPVIVLPEGYSFMYGEHYDRSVIESRLRSGYGGRIELWYINKTDSANKPNKDSSWKSYNTSTDLLGAGNYWVKVVLIDLLTDNSTNFEGKYAIGEFTVTPRIVTATISGEFIYGDDTSSFSPSIKYVGFIGGEDIDKGTADKYSYSLVDGRTDLSVLNAGTYDIILTVQGDIVVGLSAGPNYEIHAEAGKLIINKRPIVITIKNRTKVYLASDNLSDVEYEVISSLKVVNDDDLGLKFNVTTVTGTSYKNDELTKLPVGEYLITNDSNTVTNTNYDITFTRASYSVIPLKVNYSLKLSKNTIIFEDKDWSVDYEVDYDAIAEINKDYIPKGCSIDEVTLKSEFKALYLYYSGLTNANVPYGEINKKPENAGKYSVTLMIDSSNYTFNYVGETDDESEFRFEIEKKVLDDELLNVKEETYTGSNIEPAVTVDGNAYSTERFVVGKYTNLIEARTYNIAVTLTDPSNYKWASTDDPSVTKQFKIKRAELEVSEFKLEGWTYGDSANSPSATIWSNGNEVKGIAIVYEYRPITGTDADWSTTVPSNAGTYYVRVYIAETTNYEALVGTDDNDGCIEFTIAKREIKVPTLERTQDTYNGSTYTNYISDYDGVYMDATGGNLKLTISGSVASATAVDAQKYTLVITLKDAKNYAWKDGAGVNGVITLEWEILKDVTSNGEDIIEIVNKNNIVYGEGYNVDYITFKTGYGDSYVLEYRLNGTDNEWAVYEHDPKAPLGVGTYEFRVTLPETSNYGKKEVTFALVIEPKAIYATVSGQITYGDKFVYGNIKNCSIVYDGVLQIDEDTVKYTVDEKLISCVSISEARIFEFGTTYSIALATDKNGTVIGITVNSPNYVIKAQTGSLIVNKRDITITIKERSKVYLSDDTAYDSVNQYSKTSGLFGYKNIFDDDEVVDTLEDLGIVLRVFNGSGDAIDDLTTCTVDGVYWLTYAEYANTNYYISFERARYTITPLEVESDIKLNKDVIKYGDAWSVTCGVKYDGSSFVGSALERIKSELAVEKLYAYYTGTTYAGAAYGSAVKPTEAGNYTVTVMVDNDNYVIKGSEKLVIDRADVKVSNLKIKDWQYSRYSDAVNSPSATKSSSEGTIVYEYSTDGVNFTTQVPEMYMVGVYYVRVYIAQTANYNEFIGDEDNGGLISFNITKCILVKDDVPELVSEENMFTSATLTATINKFIGGAMYATDDSDLELITVGMSTTVRAVNAGTYYIYIALTDTDNYGWDTGLCDENGIVTISWTIAKYSGGNDDLGDSIIIIPGAENGTRNEQGVLCLNYIYGDIIDIRFRLGFESNYTIWYRPVQSKSRIALMSAPAGFKQLGKNEQLKPNENGYDIMVITDSNDDVEGIEQSYIITFAKKEIYAKISGTFTYGDDWSKRSKDGIDFDGILDKDRESVKYTDFSYYVADKARSTGILSVGEYPIVLKADEGIVQGITHNDYVIKVKEEYVGTLTIIPRDVTISIRDRSKVYLAGDALNLKIDEDYYITNGKLIGDDDLGLQFKVVDNNNNNSTLSGADIKNCSQDGKYSLALDTWKNSNYNVIVELTGNYSITALEVAIELKIELENGKAYNNNLYYGDEWEAHFVIGDVKILTAGMNTNDILSKVKADLTALKNNNALNITYSGWSYADEYWNSTQAPSQAGNYTAAIKLDAINYTVGGAYEKSFTIQKKVLDDKLLYTRTEDYTGGVYTPDVEVQSNKIYDETFFTADVLQYSDAGEYNITVNLKDTFNYVWTNRETATTVRFEIRKAYDEIDDELEIENWQYLDYKADKNKPSATVKSGRDVYFEYSTSKNGPFTRQVPENGVVGTYYVRVVVDESTNYHAFEGKAVEFKITKHLLTVPNLKTQSGTYTGAELSTSIDNFNRSYMSITSDGARTFIDGANATAVVVNAGVYEIFIKIEDFANYDWQGEDGGKDGIITLRWNIAKKKVALPTAGKNNFLITGENITYMPNGFDDSIMTIEDNVYSYSGYFVAVIRLKDYDNYEWDLNTGDKFINITWHITGSEGIFIGIMIALALIAVAAIGGLIAQVAVEKHTMRTEAEALREIESRDSEYNGEDISFDDNSGSDNSGPGDKQPQGNADNASGSDTDGSGANEGEME